MSENPGSCECCNLSNGGANCLYERGDKLTFTPIVMQGISNAGHTVDLQFRGISGYGLRDQNAFFYDETTTATELPSNYGKMNVQVNYPTAGGIRITLDGKGYGQMPWAYIDSNGVGYVDRGNILGGIPLATHETSWSAQVNISTKLLNSTRFCEYQTEWPNEYAVMAGASIVSSVTFQVYSRYVNNYTHTAFSAGVADQVSMLSGHRTLRKEMNCRVLFQFPETQKFIHDYPGDHVASRWLHRRILAGAYTISLTFDGGITAEAQQDGVSGSAPWQPDDGWVDQSLTQITGEVRNPFGQFQGWESVAGDPAKTIPYLADPSVPLGFTVTPGPYVDRSDVTATVRSGVYGQQGMEEFALKINDDPLDITKGEWPDEEIIRVMGYPAAPNRLFFFNDTILDEGDYITGSAGGETYHVYRFGQVLTANDRPIVEGGDDPHIDFDIMAYAMFKVEVDDEGTTKDAFIRTAYYVRKPTKNDYLNITNHHWYNSWWYGYWFEPFPGFNRSPQVSIVWP